MKVVVSLHRDDVLYYTTVLSLSKRDLVKSKSKNHSSNFTCVRAKRSNLFHSYVVNSIQIIHIESRYSKILGQR